ncbi:MAG: hypothetical protein PHZ09_02750 [Eubacteriales bacterium]|nr:hypothetical protein [Eubacteriales bacterium]
MRAEKMLIQFVVLVFLAVTLITSCSDPVSDEKSATEAVLTAEPEETEEPRIYPDLPDEKYDGMEIRIAMHPVGGTDWQDWLSRDIDTDAPNGEVINDAVYARNLAVEEKFDVIITGIENTDINVAVQKLVKAGTDDYHIVTPRIESIKSTVRNGYFVNLHNVEYMDLTKPWYDQMMIDNATILGQLYYVTGDMIILDDDSTSAMVFNKKMVTDYNMDLPYDLVFDNKWTFDKMNEMITAASKDLNGDGKADLEDQYGLLWQRDAIVSHLHAGGGRIVTIDSEGIPVLTLGDEKNYLILNKLFEIMYRDDVVINLHHLEGKQDIYQLQTKMFSEDRALMMWIRMRVVETLRNMVTDFGIIPIPKYEEAQESFYHTVNRYTGAAVAIPNSGAFDPQTIGVIIEAMSGESKYTLLEAYYETNLGTKIARDPESTMMLDIIMQNRVYDTGELYDIGSLSWDLYTMTMTNNPDFGSFMAKRATNAEKAMDKFITDFEKLALGD